ncbi:MAG: 3-keto-disaccharide hydrolase [Sphingobacteriaceae bacterium]
MKFVVKTIVVLLLLLDGHILYAQQPTLSFGTEIKLRGIKNGMKNKANAINWYNVNTAPDTWRKEKDLLICSGLPIGVMRSEKSYENFILEVEWMHMDAGGNSGVFVWSDARPDSVGRLPGGVEVQMLELDWVNQNLQNGEKPPIAYVHGELFGVGGVNTIPDNPRGERSKAVENRCKGKGEWNSYTVVCVDGVIKLSVNGKFVNGISKSTVKKGYLCLESEGAEIRFRNLKITELP